MPKFLRLLTALAMALLLIAGVGITLTACCLFARFFPGASPACISQGGEDADEEERPSGPQLAILYDGKGPDGCPPSLLFPE
ncbi:MAG TPA: hypothetical protein H9694_01705 [Firmicutes bacterium]|nr:hypothetical protein [Bacillota bacterium]